MSKRLSRIGRSLAELARDERAGETIEYAVMLGLLVVGSLLVMSSVGQTIAGRWRRVVDLL